MASSRRMRSSLERPGLLLLRRTAEAYAHRPRGAAARECVSSPGAARGRGRAALPAAREDLRRLPVGPGREGGFACGDLLGLRLLFVVFPQLAGPLLPVRANRHRPARARP